MIIEKNSIYNSFIDISNKMILGFKNFKIIFAIRFLKSTQKLFGLSRNKNFTSFELELFSQLIKFNLIFNKVDLMQKIVRIIFPTKKDLVFSKLGENTKIVSDIFPQVEF